MPDRHAFPVSQGGFPRPLSSGCRLKALTVMLLAGLAAGCTNPAESLWEDYLQRIERLTEQERAEAQRAAAQRYPRRRELRREIPDLRTGMGRYFNLARCDMMGLVSERNSVLARIEEDSLRLDYELRFLEAARRCLEEQRLTDHPEQQQWLEHVVEQKRTMLPDLYWNATLAGDEIRGFFHTSARATATGTQPGSRRAARALERLAALARQLTDEKLPSETASLEEDLRVLSQSDAGGGLLHAMAVAEDGLARAAAMLEAVERQRLCPDGRPGRNARYLENVFDEIYGGRVQPWLAALWQDMDRLGPALTDLEETLVTGNPALEGWMRHHWRGETSLQARTRRAMERHTAAWQDLLDHCDMAPG